MSIYRDWYTTIKNRRDFSVELLTEKASNRVIIAGPGSGKTRILVLKAAYLLEEVIKQPQGIACLTYSRKLAKEIKGRLRELAVYDRQNIFIGTIHGFCLSAIAKPFAEMFGLTLPRPIRIASEKRCDDTFKQSKKIVGNGYKHIKKVEKGCFYSYRNTHYLDRKLGFEVDENVIDAGMESLITTYEKLLFRDNDKPAIDFDMLIRLSLHLLQKQTLVQDVISARYPWILIDEYQDLGHSLQRMVEILLNKTSIKLFVVGDPDQCIYTFQGANSDYLKNLARRIPSTTLFENYRSSKNVDLASRIILPNHNQQLQYDSMGYCHIVKCMYGFEHQCEIAADLSKNLIRKGIKPESIAILTRNRATTTEGVRQILKALDNTDEISYRVFSNPYYRNHTLLVSWIEAAATWCALGYKTGEVRFEDIFDDWLDLNQNDLHIWSEEEIFKLRLNLYRALSDLRSPSINLLEWLKVLEDVLDFQSLFLRLEATRPDDIDHYKVVRQLAEPGKALGDVSIDKFGVAVSRPGEIVVNTLHGSKGCEHDIVMIVGGEKLSEKDRNLLYVGITRARFGLFLFYSGFSNYCQQLNDNCNNQFAFNQVSKNSFIKLEDTFFKEWDTYQKNRLKANEKHCYERDL